MYGEPFGIPEPDETVFISWFEGGEARKDYAGGGVTFYEPSFSRDHHG